MSPTIAQLEEEIRILKLENASLVNRRWAAVETDGENVRTKRGSCRASEYQLDIIIGEENLRAYLIKKNKHYNEYFPRVVFGIIIECDHEIIEQMTIEEMIGYVVKKGKDCIYANGTDYNHNQWGRGLREVTEIF